MWLIIFNVISNDDKEKLNYLIPLISDGDKNALGEIYRIAGGRMLSVAMGYTRNKEIAEDVLHDAFIKVVRFSSKYKKGSNAYAWLCTIVRNTALNKIKSERIKCGADIDSFFDISDQNINLDAKTTAIVVQNALQTLNSRERTIVWLKYYNDMTIRNIADELNMPKSTVQDVLKIAEKKLKKILE